MASSFREINNPMERVAYYLDLLDIRNLRKVERYTRKLFVEKEKMLERLAIIIQNPFVFSTLFFDDEPTPVKISVKNKVSVLDISLVPTGSKVLLEVNNADEQTLEDLKDIVHNFNNINIDDVANIIFYIVTEFNIEDIIHITGEESYDINVGKALLSTEELVKTLYSARKSSIKQIITDNNRLLQRSLLFEQPYLYDFDKLNSYIVAKHNTI